MIEGESELPSSSPFYTALWWGGSEWGVLNMGSSASTLVLMDRPPQVSAGGPPYPWGLHGPPFPKKQLLNPLWTTLLWSLHCSVFLCSTCPSLIRCVWFSCFLNIFLLTPLCKLHRNRFFVVVVIVVHCHIFSTWGNPENTIGKYLLK